MLPLVGPRSATSSAAVSTAAKSSDLASARSTRSSSPHHRRPRRPGRRPALSRTSSTSSTNRWSTRAMVVRVLATHRRELAGAQRCEHGDDDAAGLEHRQPARRRPGVLGERSRTRLPGIQAEVVDQHVGDLVGAALQVAVRPARRRPASSARRGPDRASPPPTSISSMAALRRSGYCEVVGGELDRRPLRGRRQVVAREGVDVPAASQLHHRSLRFADHAFLHDARDVGAVGGEERAGAARRGRSRRPSRAGRRAATRPRAPGGGTTWRGRGSRSPDPHPPTRDPSTRSTGSRIV